MTQSRGLVLPEHVMLAACRDERDYVENWLKGGGSPNTLTEGTRDGFSLLTAAAQNGYLHIIDLVVRYGGDVNLPERSGKTALFYAAEAGQRPAVQRLVRARALINVQCRRRGNTPLMLAAESDHTQVVELLLRSQADATLRNQAGFTAENSSRASPHSAEMLRNHSHSPLTPYSAMPPEATVPEAVLWAAAAGDLLKVGSWLTQLSANVDARGRDVDPELEGMTLLHVAALEGQDAVVRALTQRQVSVDLAGDEGETALMLAVDSGHTSAVKLLLHHRACPDVTGSHEWPSALLIACVLGHSDSVAVLLAHHASVDLPHPRGHTFDESDWEGASALHRAASNGHLECMRLLLAAAANVDLADADGSSPLEEAAWQGEGAAVDMLLDAGATQLSDAVEGAKRARHHHIVTAIQRHAKALPLAAADVVSVVEPADRGVECVAAPEEWMDANRRGQPCHSSVDFWAAMEWGGFVPLAEEELDAHDLALLVAYRRPSARAMRAKEEARARAEAEVSMRRARREENAESERQAEREREAQRRARIATERAARAASEATVHAREPGPSHRERMRPGRPARPAGMAEQIAQQRWTEERPMRAQAFAERQQAAHEEAQQRRTDARRAEERRRAAAVNMSQRARSRAHVVPGPASVADFVPVIEEATPSATSPAAVPLCPSSTCPELELAVAIAGIHGIVLEECD
jgi:ankyrin repeat protein